MPPTIKERAMALRDVAMNQIGAWCGPDLDYTQTRYKDYGPQISTVQFTVKGKKFKLTVEEVDS